MCFERLVNKWLQLSTSVTAKRMLQPSAQHAEPPVTPAKVPESLSFNEIKLQLMLNSAGLLTIAMSKEMGRPPVPGASRRALGTAAGGCGGGPVGSLAPGGPSAALPWPRWAGRGADSASPTTPPPLPRAPRAPRYPWRGGHRGSHGACGRCRLPGSAGALGCRVLNIANTSLPAKNWSAADAALVWITGSRLQRFSTQRRSSFPEYLCFRDRNLLSFLPVF